MGSKVADRLIKPNVKLGRTIWSSPQNVPGELESKCCKDCVFFADHGVTVSELCRDGLKNTIAFDQILTFGRCQNVRIWAAYGKEQPPITRSYHYCNYFKEKEND